jgi:hypothetical protein
MRLSPTNIVGFDELALLQVVSEMSVRDPAAMLQMQPKHDQLAL